MIYVDSSVALAHLLSETRRPAEAFWAESLAASRLLVYEGWTRLHARGLGRSHGDAFRELLGRLSLLEMSPTVLARATESFPAGVRTLDAVHLASALFLGSAGTPVTLASYDARLAGAARAVGLPVLEP